MFRDWELWNLMLMGMAAVKPLPTQEDLGMHMYLS